MKKLIMVAVVFSIMITVSTTCFATANEVTTDLQQTVYMLGDVNGNLEIDANDYILLKRAYFGTYGFSEEVEPYADTNDNGEIDTTDYTLLKRAYFGTYVLKEVNASEAIFSDYLDSIGFTEGLSQAKLMSKVEGFSYNGTSVKDMVVVEHYDSDFGGGCRAYGELVSYSNDYRATNDGNVTYSNSFTTEVQLEGFALPNGITFDDSIQTVLSKCAIEMNPETDFVSDDGYSGKMTLYSDENTVIELVMLSSDSEDLNSDSYKFEYSSTVPSVYRNGTVTRSVSMTFNNANKLDGFSISVQENYKK